MNCERSKGSGDIQKQEERKFSESRPKILLLLLLLQRTVLLKDEPGRQTKVPSAPNPPGNVSTRAPKVNEEEEEEAEAEEEEDEEAAAAAALALKAVKSEGKIMKVGCDLTS